MVPFCILSGGGGCIPEIIPGQGVCIPAYTWGCGCQGSVDVGVWGVWRGVCGHDVRMGGVEWTGRCQIWWGVHPQHNHLR